MALYELKLEMNSLHWQLTYYKKDPENVYPTIETINQWRYLIIYTKIKVYPRPTFNNRQNIKFKKNKNIIMRLEIYFYNECAKIKKFILNSFESILTHRL